MCWRSNRKSRSPSQKIWRRDISTSGLASSAPVTFLFCLILVYIVVFRPEWPPYRLRRLGNRSGMPGSFARYYFRLARRRFVAYSATPITPSVEEYRNQHQLTPLLDFLQHLNAMLIGAPSIGAYVENGFSRKKWSRKPQRDQIWSTYRGTMLELF